MGSSSFFVAPHTSGSCSRTHSALGAWKPGSAGLPVFAMSFFRPPAASTMSPHCGTARWSFQRIAGRSGVSAGPRACFFLFPRKTAPCIWPESPIALTWSFPTSASLMTARVALPTAVHHFAASCSLCPGAGRCTVCGAVAPRAPARSRR